MTTRRVDRMIDGMRVRFSTRARTAADHRLRLALVEKLLRQGATETVELLRQGGLAWATVIAADRQGRLGYLGQDLQLHEPIGDTSDRLFPRSHTGIRYRDSLAALMRETGIRPSDPILRLRTVAWDRLAEGWPASPDDWNHLRRAVSRLLSLLVGKKHPLRLEIVAQIPIKPTVARQVLLPLERLSELPLLLGTADRRHVALLLATGLRKGEWERLTPEHLAGGWVLAVPGTKTAKAVRTFRLDPRVHLLASEALANPRSEWHLRQALAAASRRLGIGGIRIHDLRHLAGQLAEKALWPDGVVNYWLGHAPGMTQRYTRRPPDPTECRRLADLLADWLPATATTARQRRQG